MGPFKNFKRPPINGYDLIIGGRRLLDLGIKNVVMILAAIRVTSRSVAMFKNFGSNSILLE